MGLCFELTNESQVKGERFWRQVTGQGLCAKQRFCRPSHACCGCGASGVRRPAWVWSLRALDQDWALSPSASSSVS